MGIDNLAQFNAELNNYARQLRAGFRKWFRAIGFDLLASIIERTPVGNIKNWAFPPPPGSGYTGGRAKGNWQVGINVTSEDPTDRIDPTGEATLSEGASNMQGALLGDSIHIYNNVPYIVRLEEGWSKIAPQGMVKLALEEIRMKYGEASPTS